MRDVRRGHLARITALALIFAAGGTAAVAQREAGTGLDPLLQCETIVDPTQRLDCFDKVAAALKQALAAGTLVVLDRQAVRSTRRSLFGLDVSLPFFRGDKGEEAEPREITAKASFVRQVGVGYWLVGIDNGAVWQTTEAKPRLSPPSAGDTIIIRKGAAGGYFLKSGSMLLRAKRTR